MKKIPQNITESAAQKLADKIADLKKSQAKLKELEKNNQPPIFEESNIEIEKPHEPRIKSVYGYNDDGVYVSQTFAYECPIEKDVWHLPKNTTDIKPMEEREGYNIVFDKERNAWKYVSIIKDPEIKPSVDESESKEQLSERMRSMRDDLLKSTDYIMMPDVQGSLTKGMQKAWLDYRRSLRDITKNEFFPYIDFPEKPTAKK